MSPLPGSGVFHPLWNSHHRPTATTALTSACTITRPGTGTGSTDSAGNWTPPSAVVVYTGVCRIQAQANDDRVSVVGEEQVTTGRYNVSGPWDMDAVAIGDEVAVTAADDPLLVGRVLIVLDVIYGSQQWQRDLVCQDNLDFGGGLEPGTSGYGSGGYGG